MSAIHEAGALLCLSSWTRVQLEKGDPEWVSLQKTNHSIPFGLNLQLTRALPWKIWNNFAPLHFFDQFHPSRIIQRTANFS